MTQINYVSRNQLHCKANLNFDLMWLGFVNKLFISVQLIVFLDHVLLLAELAQKFKFLQNSCMAKRFHETELRGIYLYQMTEKKKLVDFARAKLHVYADVLKESQRRTLHITMGQKLS